MSALQNLLVYGTLLDYETYPVAALRALTHRWAEPALHGSKTGDWKLERVAVRWLVYSIGLVVTLVLQSVVAPRVEVFSVRPDWLLVFVIFTALHASVRDAVLSAWILGFAADLLTVEHFGFLSLSYVIIALLTLAVREALVTSSMLALGLVTLGLGVVVQSGWLIYRFVALPVEGWTGLHVVGNVLEPALYTAVWVVLWYPLLENVKPWLVPSRRTRD